MAGEGNGWRGRVGLLVLGLALAAVVAALAFRSVRSTAPEQAAATGAPAEASSIAALEARVAAKPDDAAAWQALGFARFQSGDFAKAAEAYARASALDQTSAVVLSALGEAQVMASAHDPMPAEALAAFRKALAIDPKDPRARYFMAVKRDLDGDHAGALNDWLALLADTPPGAPWESDLVRTIEQVGKINKLETAKRLADAKAAQARAVPGSTAAPSLVAGEGIPGPSQEQIDAARAMSPGQQREMAEGMVAGLEAKLRANPKNLDGWAMLMRSRMTLGQVDLARKALADAKAANHGAAARLDQEAGVLGLK